MAKQFPIHVVIADDCSLIRFSLSKLLGSYGGYQVDFEAENGKQLINYIKSAAIMPDICILDIGMPEMNGYDTINILKRNWPSIKVLVLSVFCQDYSIRYMLRKGANGFLSKTGAMSVIHDALFSIITKDYYYSDIATKEMFEEAAGISSRVYELSEKQKEVLSFIHLGLSNKDIADKMGIAKSTVEDYRNILCNKLNLKSRSELIHFAIKNELV
jgi:DNA-binding NarL/FixJ family response regulator